MQFAWDERKNHLNKKKHRVSFETAALVFEDPSHLSIADREMEGELRWQTLGMAPGMQILLVAHTIEEDEGEVSIRIISARKATPQERSIYAKGR